MGDVEAGEERLNADAKKAKINAIWEKLNAKDPLPAPKVGRSKVQKVSKGNKAAKNVPSWMVNLGLAPVRVSTITKSGQVEGGNLLKCDTEVIQNTGQVQTDQACVVKEEIAIPTASDTGSKEKEVLHSVGKGAELTTSSEPVALQESKAAQGLRRKSQMQASSSSGLDGLLQQINKKQKPNILDRSRKDWGVFKEEKGLEDELEAYKKSGDKYLDKVAFLQRADVREYEKERDARLALHSKQRSETVPLD